MSISVKVLADSSYKNGRLCTLHLTYPRIVHAELMTHRVFSRNASSSRAISFEKSLKSLETEGFIPHQWRAEQKGMQSGDVLPEDISANCAVTWEKAKKAAIEYSQELFKLGVHKSICNRLLEPFSNINVIVSSTEWENFFQLRCSGLAEPHMAELAYMMRDALALSVPKKLKEGEWHLPFVDANEIVEYGDKIVLISVARCARISYTPHGEPLRNPPKDIELANQLATNKHLSPFEHQAMAKFTGLHGNFAPQWTQHRKLVESKLSVIVE